MFANAANFKLKMSMREVYYEVHSDVLIGHVCIQYGRKRSLTHSTTLASVVVQSHQAVDTADTAETAFVAPSDASSC